MSKKVKVLLAIICTVVIGSGAYVILNPKEKMLEPEAEITIKEAQVEDLSTMVYKDWAGFSFEYPQELRVEPIETEDTTVYSSLEMSKGEGEMIKLRVADTGFKDLDSWQKAFEEKNVVGSIRELYWADIPAKQLAYGAPKRLLTVAIEEGVIYTLESPADQNGFWDKSHRTILNSFEFEESVYAEEEEAEPVSAESGDEDIVLIEEVIE